MSKATALSDVGKLGETKEEDGEEKQTEQGQQKLVPLKFQEKEGGGSFGMKEKERKMEKESKIEKRKIKKERR